MDKKRTNTAEEGFSTIGKHYPRRNKFGGNGTINGQMQTVGIVIFE